MVAPIEDQIFMTSVCSMTDQASLCIFFEVSIMFFILLLSVQNHRYKSEPTLQPTGWRDLLKVSEYGLGFHHFFGMGRLFTHHDREPFVKPCGHGRDAKHPAHFRVHPCPKLGMRPFMRQNGSRQPFLRDEYLGCSKKQPTLRSSPQTLKRGLRRTCENIRGADNTTIEIDDFFFCRHGNACDFLSVRR